MKKISTLFVALLLFVVAGYCGRVDTIQVFSPDMQKEVPVVVVVPDNYVSMSQTQYPVLYLLHGYGGNYANWIKNVPELQHYVDEFEMIVVCPDGGYNSWYFDSPIKKEVRYETFMTKTLVPQIDSAYRTMKGRYYRGIAGLSMGGHGALYLAIRHQSLFGAAAALSGGVDLRPFPDNWDLKDQLGSLDTHKENWEKNSVINLADQLKDRSLVLSIDVGVNDFFLDVNRALHKKLLDLGVGHDYIERPGAHNWDYWKRVLPYEMQFFKDYFYKNNLYDYQAKK